MANVVPKPELVILNDCEKPARRIILLPGMHGTAGLFAPLTARLANHFEVVALGYTPGSGDEYEELYQRLVRVASDGGPILLLAESYSSPLAIRFAAENGAALHGLILCSGFSRLPAAAAVACRVFSRCYTSSLLEVAGRLPFIPRYLREVLAEVSQVPADVMRSRFRRLARLDESSPLRQVQVPVLVVAGRHDRLIPAGHTRSLQTCLPNSTLHIAEGGHFFLLQPGLVQVADEIIDFATRCQPK